MPISKVGISNRRRQPPSVMTVLVRAVGKKGNGFTLLELIIVMMIMGMVAFLVIPRIGSFRAGEMKRTSLRLSSLIQQLTQDSSSTKEHYRLYFNLDTNEYWTVLVKQKVRETDHALLLFEEPKGVRSPLPSGILFEDIVTGQKGKVTAGEVFSEFYPIGIEPIAIHLKEGESKWTLIANPLTGRVKMSDGYVEALQPS